LQEPGIPERKKAVFLEKEKLKEAQKEKESLS